MKTLGSLILKQQLICYFSRVHGSDNVSNKKNEDIKNVETDNSDSYIGFTALVMNLISKIQTNKYKDRHNSCHQKSKRR